MKHNEIHHAGDQKQVKVFVPQYIPEKTLAFCPLDRQKGSRFAHCSHPSIMKNISAGPENQGFPHTVRMTILYREKSAFENSKSTVFIIESIVFSVTLHIYYPACNSIVGRVKTHPQRRGAGISGPLRSPFPAS